VLLYNLAYPVKKFVGLQNYARILAKPLFWLVIRNTIVYTLGIMIPSIGVSLFLAILLNKQIRFRPFYRMAFFYPYIIPMVAASMLWVWMYSPIYGLINYILSFLYKTKIDWLGDKRIALYAVMIVAIWKFIGYYMILFLAGLQSIPGYYYEAAKLQGANEWQQFRHITFPLLGPTMFFVGIIFVINSFQSVDQIYTMTEGGPGNSTNLVLYYIYLNAFKWMDIGTGAALSSISFMVLIGLTLIYFHWLEKRVYYE